MITTKGILLAGGKGTRLAPLTISINKHLLPIYDKPMIYYPLSTLMLCGIREIALITNKEDILNFKKLLGDGSRLGIKIEYFIQEEPNGIPEAFSIAKNFIKDYNCVLILGDNLLIGNELGYSLKSHINKVGATILAYQVTNPIGYGVVEFDKSGKVKSLEEKPKFPKSPYAIPGIYFFDKNVTNLVSDLIKSPRGEYEIIDLLEKYMQRNELNVVQISRGSGWIDTGTTENLYAASEFVRILQNRQGLYFNVPEEIAFRNKWISRGQLIELAAEYKNTNYGEYLITVSEY